MTFGITCRCENNTNLNDIRKCVDSITKFYPNSKIVIVDSNSPNKEYMNLFNNNNNVIIEDIANKNYEAGAIWYVYDNHIDDKYIFLQDSMVLETTLDEYLDKDFTAINYYEGWKDGKPPEKEFARKSMESTPYIYMEDNFKMVQFNSFLVSRKIMSILKENKVDNIKPFDKNGSKAMERIWGMIFTQEGLTTNPTFKNNISKIWRQRK